MLRHCLIPLSILLAGCNTGASGFGGSSAKGQDKDAAKTVEHRVGDESGSTATATTPPVEDEASAPLIVSGAYMTCADAKVPDSETADLAVGCNLSDKKTDKPIALKGLVKDDGSWSWRATPLADAKGVTVKVEENKSPKDDEPQALYLFSGGDAGTRRAFADGTVAQLDVPFKEKVDGVDFFAATLKDAKAGADNKTRTKGPVDAGSSSSDNPTLDSTGDEDKDGVLNGEDRCDNTAAGAPIWTRDKVTKANDSSLEKWIGCSGGEYNDRDDADHDKVPDVFDKCPATPIGETVIKTENDPRRGCATGETPNKG